MSSTPSTPDLESVVEREVGADWGGLMAPARAALLAHLQAMPPADYPDWPSVSNFLGASPAGIEFNRLLALHQGGA